MAGKLALIKKGLKEIGYKSSEITGKKKTEDLILNILKTRDARLIKSIPFIIYRSSPEPLPFLEYVLDLDKLIKNSMKNKKIMGNAAAILIMTMAVFKQCCPNNMWIRRIGLALGKNKQFRQSKSYEGIIRDLNEYIDEFTMQKEAYEYEQKTKLPQEITISKERDIQFARSKIFTRKEKEILDRINFGDKLTRTEYNYFISKTKKKLESIIILKEYAETMLRKKAKFE